MFQNNHNLPAGLSQFDLYVHEKVSQSEGLNMTRRYDVGLSNTADESNESQGWLSRVRVIVALHNVSASFAHLRVAGQH
jgi:hypothetical protein